MCFAAWRSSTRRLLFTERKRADSFFFLRGRNVPGAFNYITPPHDYTVHVKLLSLWACVIDVHVDYRINIARVRNCSAHRRLRFVFFYFILFILFLPCHL